ncbi:NACHT domain- and WD repeat-containing protein 1 [Discoglossus pictus]
MLLLNREMDKETLRDILRGKKTDLSPEPSKVVRIFISSTFSDMVEERDALMELAYPEVQAFCQKKGLAFEVVDMRWGVPDYASVDHMTTELCVKEIESCQRTSIGPFFIGLVGQRYGFRPIPHIISEEEFNILYNKVQMDKSDAELLMHWFWKDQNADPPCYILQPITTHLPHYSDTNPTNAGLQKQEAQEWKSAEKRLSQALRKAALEAHMEGLITSEQKHKYFKSVTEWEIESGFLHSSSNNAKSTIFFREVKDVDLCADKIFHFLDLKEDGSPDTEAQEFLRNLKDRIIQEHSDQVKTHVVEMSKQKVKKKYLQELCDQVIAVVNHQILKSLSKEGVEQPEQQTWQDWLMQEITHHLSLSHKKSQVFCGRQDLLQSIMNSVKYKGTDIKSPLVIYGASGSGKTAVMCKAFEMLRSAAAGDGEVVLILRLLGTSPRSTEIHDVLKGICYQVCLALDLPPPSAQVTNIYNETVRFFQQLLTGVSERRKESLILFLDSLDQLSPSDGAHHMHWLPKECPYNVYIVVSTLPQESGILKTLQQTIKDPASYLEVQPLPTEQGGEMIKTLMASAGRKLTNVQLDIILGSFKKCGHPLLLRLAFDEAKRWTSYTPPSQLAIATSTKAAVLQLYQRLEQLHGKSLVHHALGYISASRSGLSETELKDILSLDDEVLSHIYEYWAPPSDDVIKCPSLPWTRLRLDLEGYLVERQADGSTVLGLYHRQFIEVAQEIYLSGSEKTKLHNTLAEYFLGTWSSGNKRPIYLPFIKKSLNADRKVAPQPLWFSEDTPNLRKMNELTYHLLQAGRIEELKIEVLGNMDWISSKIISCGINNVIKDFKMCAQQVDCTEVSLVHDTLRLFQPTINFIEGRIDPCIIYTEMLARLHFFKQTCPSMIGDMCQQCITWFDRYSHPTLIPKYGFFQPPGGPLQTTVTGFKKGITTMELSADYNILVVGSDDGTMIVWDVKEIEVIHTLTGHSAGIKCVKVFGSGTRAVSGSLDNTLLLWNLLTGKRCLCIEEDHSNYGNAYLYVDERSSILYSAAGSQVYAYNIESGALVLRLSPGVPDFPLQAAMFSPQQLIITVTEGGTVHIWDSSSGDLRGSRQLPDVDGQAADPVCSCVIHKYGKMVVGFKNGYLALISTGGAVSTEKMPTALTFIVAADDESLFAAGFGKQVQIFRADSNTFRTFLSSCLEHEDLVECAVINSKKNIVVTGSQDETIRVSKEDISDLLCDCQVPGNSTAARLLEAGFREGFRILCDTELQGSMGPNLLSASEFPGVASKKVQTEVQLGRMAGPFASPPIQDLVVSPLGGVLKKEKGKFRLIQHLSYPRGRSVNDGIYKDQSTVSYESFDRAAEMVRLAGAGALLAKVDIEAAFRLLPVHLSSHRLLGCFVDGSYFIDLCLPMGCSISCAYFEAFSTFLQWVARLEAGYRSITHYLDDFLFVGPAGQDTCRFMLEVFTGICQAFGVPLAHNKTKGPTTKLTFLGIRIDSLTMECSLPWEKVVDMRAEPGALEGTRLQSIIGKLNFACRIIPMGTIYCRRMSLATAGILRPHNFIKVSRAIWDDARVWSVSWPSLMALRFFRRRAPPELELYTDASGSVCCGTYFHGRWWTAAWPEEWVVAGLTKNLAFLKLFPIVAAVHIWGSAFPDRRVLFHTDNMGVLQAVNNITATSIPVVQLLCHLVLCCLLLNIWLQARHVPGVENGIADALSRFQENRFSALAPQANDAESHEERRGKLDEEVPGDVSDMV